MTRKELLSDLESKGICICRSDLENYQLEELLEVVDSFEEEETEDYEEDETEDPFEKIPVSEWELIGTRNDKVNIFHIIYPYSVAYTEGKIDEIDFFEFAKLHNTSEMLISDDLDACIFYEGKEEDAEELAEEFINYTFLEGIAVE